MSFPVVIDPTLTVSSVESDGFIYKSSSNYTTAWSAGEGTISIKDSYISIGQSKVFSFPPDYRIRRGFFFFDTSSIPSNACIESAVLSLYKKDDYSDTDFIITVQNGQPDHPHDSLMERDYYKDYYSGNGGELNTVNFVNGFNNITLTEHSWINMGGVTKLCLRSSRDINGIVPTGSEYVNVYSANVEEEFNPDPRPKLVIVYRNQSKIVNTGSTNITGYLLMQVHFFDGKEWVVDHDTVNETSPRMILVGEHLALDTIFNGLVNTNDLSHGSGLYRVYAAFRDPIGDVLVCDDSSLLETSYEFTVNI